MAENSKIEWCHDTFNPWRGCQRVSEGCRNCYAETLSHRNPATLGTWGPNGKGTRVVATEAYWRKPLIWNKVAKESGTRRRVFCASLADVFEAWDGPMIAANGNRLWWCQGSMSNSPLPSTGLPEGCRFATMGDVRERLFDLIDATPYLDWLLLTKRPENIKNMLPPLHDTGPCPVSDPDCEGGDGNRHDACEPGIRTNLWVGASVEDQATANERIPHLLQIPVKVRFLSCEPLLGPVDLFEWKSWEIDDADDEMGYQTLPFQWVIAGGESGPNARPMHQDWARLLRDQCQATDVPFLFKQWGEWKPIPEMPEAEYMAYYQSRRLAKPGEDQAIIDEMCGRDCTIPTRQFQYDGCDGSCVIDRHASMMMFRVGKKAAGRLLDGQLWDQFPKGVS